MGYLWTSPGPLWTTLYTRVWTGPIICREDSTFNFPKQKAAEIAIKTVKSFIDHSEIVKKVIFNVFDDENLNIYQKLLAK